MSRRPRKRRNSGPENLRINGRNWPVIERRHIGGRTYLILEKTGAADRQRFRAFDPQAGPRGELRAIYLLPRSHASRQHIGVLQRLSGRNDSLPTILDCRFQRDHVVLVLTWIRGIDLRQYLDRVRAGRTPHPSPLESFRLIRGLAHGLSQIHRHVQVIHGDIRPENLILTSGPTRLIPIDFGTAWQAEQTSRRDLGDGNIPVYTAPELQLSGVGDFRSDQFALTLVLYELLTLQHPYGGLGGKAGLPEFADAETTTLASASRQHSQARRLPRSLWTLIDRLLATGLSLDPSDRYETPRAWLDAFDEIDSRVRTLRFPDNRLTLLTRVTHWFGDLYSTLPFLKSEP